MSNRGLQFCVAVRTAELGSFGDTNQSVSLGRGISEDPLSSFVTHSSEANLSSGFWFLNATHACCPSHHRFKIHLLQSHLMSRIVLLIPPTHSHPPRPRTQINLPPPAFRLLNLLQLHLLSLLRILPRLLQKQLIVSRLAILVRRPLLDSV